MLSIQYNIPLKPLNTFGIEAQAAALIPINSLECLKQIHTVNKEQLPYFILGGGSNLLLTKDMDRCVLKNEIKGIEILSEDDHTVTLKVGGGEVWHEFVMYCVKQGWGGVENLALIPGTVGAAPIQNIGAYGVEVQQVIDTVYAYDLIQKSTLEFKRQDCQFGYRESIFKRQYKNKLFIYAVTCRLSKNPSINTSYGDIQKTLHELSLEPNVQNVAKAVIHIRQSKLPDPKKIGNSGSFFKNPEIAITLYNSLKLLFPTLPGYISNETTIKIPAAWLIEQCGWKGIKRGNYGVHEKQALVLVNYGNANGNDIYNLSEEIIQSVQDKFKITLEREVQVW
jgi:UDP-N-acetylmuramate dehydrogenase